MLTASSTNYMYLIASLMLAMAGWQLFILIKASFANKTSYELLKSRGVWPAGRKNLEAFIDKNTNESDLVSVAKNIIRNHKKIVRACWLISFAAVLVVIGFSSGIGTP